MLYTVNEKGNVEVIDLGITAEDRKRWAEIDALWEVMEETEEDETQND